MNRPFEEWTVEGVTVAAAEAAELIEVEIFPMGQLLHGPSDPVFPVNAKHPCYPALLLVSGL